MSFRLRRGTDTERQSVVFAEGELVYTTDTKELYVGDGTTLGGIRITGAVAVSPIALTRNLDMNGFDIVGSGDIDISGQITANNFYGNGSGLTNLPALDVNNGATYQISIMGADSSILVNSDTSELSGNFFGNFVGDGSGLTNLPIVDPIVDGNNYQINIFGIDSTLIVDSETGVIRPNSIYTNLFNTDTLEIRKPTFSVDPFEIRVIGNGDTTAIKIITQSDSALSGTFYSGKLWFGYEDSTGSDVTSGILGGEDALYFVSNSSSDFSIETNYLTWQEPGKLGIGTFTPAQELDVRGNAIVTGFVQFGSLTSTERNLLIPAAGMVIWNETTTQFEGFNGTNWINLVDGVISA